MPIYRYFNERVKYFKPITTPYGYKYSYYSGNMFESLASTNPELFETKKLEQIMQSKNAVIEFNDYVFDAMSKDIDRYVDFVKKNTELTKLPILSNSLSEYLFTSINMYSKFGMYF